MARSSFLLAPHEPPRGTPSRSRRNSTRDREWTTPGRSARRHLLPAQRSHKSLALGLLASELVGSTDCVSFFPVRFFGRLFVKPSTFHLAKNAFALQFLLECPRSLSTSLSRTNTWKNIPSCSSKANSPNQKTPISDRVEATFGAPCVPRQRGLEGGATRQSYESLCVGLSRIATHLISTHEVPGLFRCRFTSVPC